VGLQPLFSKQTERFTVVDDPTFEETAGAERLVAWFYARGFAINATAPRIDNDWAVETFSTEEGLSGFPCALHEPYPSKRTFQLAAEIIDDDFNSTGWWWNAAGWRDADEAA